MFGLGGSELLVILFGLLILFGVPFVLGYYIGLSKGRKESMQRSN